MVALANSAGEFWFPSLRPRNLELTSNAVLSALLERVTYLDFSRFFHLPLLEATLTFYFISSAGLISTNVFRTEDAPKYEPAVAVSAAFAGICLVTTATWGVYQRWDNRRRDRLQGKIMRAQDVDTSKLKDGWKSQDFRWVVWTLEDWSEGLNGARLIVRSIRILEDKVHKTQTRILFRQATDKRMYECSAL